MTAFASARPLPRWAGVIAALGIAVGIGILIWSHAVDAQHQAQAAQQAERSISDSRSADRVIAAARASRFLLPRAHIGTLLIRWVDQRPQAPAQDRILVLMAVKDIASNTSPAEGIDADQGIMPVGYHLSTIPGLIDAANQRMVPLLARAAR